MEPCVTFPTNQNQQQMERVQEDDSVLAEKLVFMCLMLEKKQKTESTHVTRGGVRERERERAQSTEHRARRRKRIT